MEGYHRTLRIERTTRFLGHKILTNQFAPTEDAPDGRLMRPSSVGIFDVCWFCPLELMSIVDGPVGGAINVEGGFIEGKFAGFKVVC